MPDIYQAIAENDAKITTANETIAALSLAISTHLTGEKGHVSSYKIGDREISFSVESFQKEISRLKAEVIQLRAESHRLTYLKSVFEGTSGSSGRIMVRM
jgi:hypothetical protein